MNEPVQESNQPKFWTMFLSGRRMAGKFELQQICGVKLFLACEHVRFRCTQVGE